MPDSSTENVGCSTEKLLPFGGISVILIYIAHGALFFPKNKEGKDALWVEVHWT